MDSHYIDEVLKGNSNAFSYFIKTYQNKAFGVAVSIVKSEDDAKDVVQDSFVAAYSSLHKFRVESKFSTWFYRIVVNKALQFIKQEKRKHEVVGEYSISDGERTALNDAIGQLEKQELKKLIKAVFEKIPAKEALVLQLFYIDEQNMVEIEAITMFTKSNVKVLLHRGRTSFYKVLKEQNLNEYKYYE
ncbi:RNA polymerase sigma-70 factor, ECF subfamily [Marivirga sericea]|uniref:RNA polymerase sigma-70 factor, ECF subfamily n=1 Tax=Marivirga sericea TaxID=1028 RepID=A0A1X7K554_9BACT|nr:RNA polymerase sigma factor [Marivirga sericea]SMG35844.1 RNA polymerase sigma-70 factor, ECF subfamily [Marivirga sericea]